MVLAGHAVRHRVGGSDSAASESRALTSASAPRASAASLPPPARSFPSNSARIAASGSSIPLAFRARTVTISTSKRSRSTGPPRSGAAIALRLPDPPLSETGAAVPEATGVGAARLPAPRQKRRPGLGHRARDHARSRCRGARVPGARTHQHPRSRELNAPGLIQATHFDRSDYLDPRELKRAESRQSCSRRYYVSTFCGFGRYGRDRNANAVTSSWLGASRAGCHGGGRASRTRTGDLLAAIRLQPPRSRIRASWRDPNRRARVPVRRRAMAALTSPAANLSLHEHVVRRC